MAALSGCAGGPRPACGPGERAAVLDTVYFGLAKPDGTMSDEDWRGFLAAEVTPRFPDGLTWWPAHGQWRPKGGEVRREPSVVLEIAHGDSGRDRAALREIVAAYKSRHGQEGVMRVRTHVCLSF